MRTMRTVGLIVGGILIASVGCLVALTVWLGWAGLGLGVTIGGLVLVSYLEFVGPWQRRWGANDDEVGRSLPGDDFLGPGAATTTRAISIAARPEDVFPWLLQIGYGRGGWYSYDWIDNDGVPSVDRIDPALRFGVGDRIEMVPGLGPTVREIVPDHHVVSGGETDSWCLLVEPDGDGTRLISRWRQRWPKTIATDVWVAVVDPGAFLMERKMLLNIRDRAERTVVDRGTALAQSRTLPG
jgi:hypothetical protein